MIVRTPCFIDHEARRYFRAGVTAACILVFAALALARHHTHVPVGDAHSAGMLVSSTHHIPLRAHLPPET
jgi:hypothetical protein